MSIPCRKEIDTTDSANSARNTVGCSHNAPVMHLALSICPVHTSARGALRRRFLGNGFATVERPQQSEQSGCFTDTTEFDTESLDFNEDVLQHHIAQARQYNGKYYALCERITSNIMSAMALPLFNCGKDNML